MTQEQKAQAYDEALGWMREMYPCLTDSLREDAEHYFPELRESEDERIREELKEAFEAYDIESTWNGIPIRSIFAWLEKQKEQKPLTDEEKEYIRTIKSIISDFIRDKKPENLAYYQRIYDWLDGKHVPFSCGHEGAKWSEEDEKMLKWLCRIIHSRVVNKELSLAEESDLGKWIDKWINYEPQPVQKWDEFDEEGIYQQVVKGIRDMCDRYEQNGMFTDERARDFLGNVRVKCKDAIECAPILDEPSWKPSEQEKGALRTAIYVLTEERNFPKAAAQLQNILNAFEGKESRKDWKPSEKQMDSLRDTIVNTKGYSYSIYLPELYEQLKKL